MRAKRTDSWPIHCVRCANQTNVVVCCRRSARRKRREGNVSICSLERRPYIKQTWCVSSKYSRAQYLRRAEINYIAWTGNVNRRGKNYWHGTKHTGFDESILEFIMAFIERYLLFYDRMHVQIRCRHSGLAKIIENDLTPERRSMGNVTCTYFP